MEMRTVYRYEGQNGMGPYQLGAWPDDADSDKLCAVHNYRADHPAWGVDFYSHWKLSEEGYLAACDSREALDTWFDGWQDQLEANGFKVVEYTVPAENVVDGYSGLQCAFLPVTA